LDAENAIKALEEVTTKLRTSGVADMDSYIIAVHGIKNALANIGEAELSDAAFRLEQAGDAQDFAVITEETPAFMEALRFLIDKFKPADNHETTEISVDDTFFLRDKLRVIKTACETFDIVVAKEALEDLQRKKWPRHINRSLDEISVHLLHSAFKKAAAAAENMAKM